MAHATTITAPPPEQRLVMTCEAFLAWLGNEGAHAEWVDGEAIVFMPTTVFHGRASMFLATLLSPFVRYRDLGEVLGSSLQMRVRDGRSSREPDLFFVTHRHRVLGTRSEGPADLVVEPVSADSEARDREAKFAEYAAVGVPADWLHDHRPGNQRSDFYRLTPDRWNQPIPPDADGRVHSAVLPGFWLRPDWLRHDPLPDPLACLQEIAPTILGTVAAASTPRSDGA